MSKQVRQIILDTETTGADSKRGDRVIEIGCVELIDRKPTGRTFHEYLNPEGKRSEPGALKVHNIQDEFLYDKPTFRQVSDRFIDFISGSQVLIHNKDFDVTFLNEELKRAGKKQMWEFCEVECTYQMAQGFFPGQRNGLDKLRERLGVGTQDRTFHGALLDAQILAEVYLKMTENAEAFVDDEMLAKKIRSPIVRLETPRTPRILTATLSIDEGHQRYLEQMQKDTKVVPLALTQKSSGLKI